MIPLPAGFQASLDKGVTTLCWCWLVTRNDGAVLGFTDHDRALEVAGVTCEPQSGFCLRPGALRGGCARARRCVRRAELGRD